jgi:hypothetical protein
MATRVGTVASASRAASAAIVKLTSRAFTEDALKDSKVLHMLEPPFRQHVK